MHNFAHLTDFIVVQNGLHFANLHNFKNCIVNFIVNYIACSLFHEMNSLVHSIQSADQCIDGSENDIGVGADAPVVVVFFIGDADIGSSFRIGIRADGMF